MNASSICKQLHSNIQNNNLTGVVHSVFDSVVNIITSDNEFVSFIILDKPMAPNAIKLSQNISYLQLGIKSGMKVYFHNKYVWIENLNIILEYSKASEWDKNPIFTYSKDNYENVNIKLNAIKDFLVYEGKTEGVLSLLTTLNEGYIGFELDSIDYRTLDQKDQFIKDRFLRFIEAYLLKCNLSIADRVKNIIGFGAGLTPSIDDFILGLMITRIYLSDYLNKDVNESIKFNEKMVMQIDGKTTKVSEEMLKFSSRGEVNEDIRNLMLSFISDATLNEFIQNLKIVGKFGETSGTDIIAGVYIESKILFNQYSRR